MAAPSITLSKPMILVTRSFSTLGITSQSDNFVFGYVEKIYDTCDRVTVAQTVFFDFRQARQILYGSTMYYLIDEQYVEFSEPALS